MTDYDKIIPYIGSISDNTFIRSIINNASFISSKRRMSQITIWSGLSSLRTGFFHEFKYLISSIDKFIERDKDLRCDGIVISHRYLDDDISDHATYTYKNVSRVTLHKEAERAEQIKDLIVRLYTSDYRLYMEHSSRLCDSRNMRVRSYMIDEDTGIYISIMSKRHDPIRDQSSGIPNVISTLVTHKCPDGNMFDKFNDMPLMDMTIDQLRKISIGEGLVSKYVKDSLVNRLMVENDMKGDIKFISNTNKMLIRLVGSNYKLSVSSAGLDVDEMLYLRNLYKMHPEELMTWLDDEIIKCFHDEDVSEIVSKLSKRLVDLANGRDIKFNMQCKTMDGKSGSANVVIGDFEEIVELIASNCDIKNTDHTLRAVKHSQRNTIMVHTINILKNKVVSLDFKTARRLNVGKLNFGNGHVRGILFDWQDGLPSDGLPSDGPWY